MDFSEEEVFAFPLIFFESSLLPTTATAQLFGQSLFAPAGKSLFEVRPTTIIIGRLGIPFGGLQARQKKVSDLYAGTDQTTNQPTT